MSKIDVVDEVCFGCGSKIDTVSKICTNCGLCATCDD